MSVTCSFLLTAHPFLFFLLFVWAFASVPSSPERPRFFSSRSTASERCNARRNPRRDALRPFSNAPSSVNLIDVNSPTVSWPSSRLKDTGFSPHFVGGLASRMTCPLLVVTAPDSLSCNSGPGAGLGAAARTASNTATSARRCLFTTETSSSSRLILCFASHNNPPSLTVEKCFLARGTLAHAIRLRVSADEHQVATAQRTAECDVAWHLRGLHRRKNLSVARAAKSAPATIQIKKVSAHANTRTVLSLWWSMPAPATMRHSTPISQYKNSRMSAPLCRRRRLLRQLIVEHVRKIPHVTRAILCLHHHHVPFEMLDGNTNVAVYLVVPVVIRPYVQHGAGVHRSSLSRRLVPLDAGITQQLLNRVQVVVVREERNHVLRRIVVPTEDAVRATLDVSLHTRLTRRRRLHRQHGRALRVALVIVHHERHRRGAQLEANRFAEVVVAVFFFLHAEELFGNRESDLALRNGARNFRVRAHQVHALIDPRFTAAEHLAECRHRVLSLLHQRENPVTLLGGRHVRAVHVLLEHHHVFVGVIGGVNEARRGLEKRHARGQQATMAGHHAEASGESHIGVH